MKAIAIVGLIVTTGGFVSAGQDRLDVAKDLYASAAYEEALSALAQLSEGATADVARRVNQYRAFCLFALGRTAEAEQVAETLIRKDPFVTLDEGEVSPRIEAMFTSVRKRLLPILIREEYQVARSAVEGKDLARAEPHLVLVSRMLADARNAGVIDDTLADLSFLVDGFLNLSRATTEQAVARAAAARVAEPPAPAPPAPRAVPVTGPAAATGSSTVYTSSGDPRVSPPAVISQSVPRLPLAIVEAMRLATRQRVVLDVLISEKGDVQDVSMTESALQPYDEVVLRAARMWRYRPATLDGVPVKFRKLVTVAFRDQ